MPINKETIISVFDDKLTLMQWLKTINKALEDAVLTGVEITKKGNATLSFKFTFEDGTYLETNDLVLQQGESVVGAYIQNGHLYLTLSNGTNLDAGNVKPVSNFSIDANQHLIVNYADGTSQDLGTIFSGNVNISGTLNATAITGDSIIENMGASYGYSDTEKDPCVTLSYVGVVKNGNKITFVWAGSLRNATQYSTNLGRINIPTEIGSKLYPDILGYLDEKQVYMVKNAYDLGTSLACAIDKLNNNQQIRAYIRGATGLDADTDYAFRIEATFLLSNNLIQ